MIIRNIEFKLKNGRNALIRSPRDEDIQEMLDYLYISAGETDLITRQCLYAWLKEKSLEIVRLHGVKD